MGQARAVCRCCCCQIFSITNYLYSKTTVLYPSSIKIRLPLR